MEEKTNVQNYFYYLATAVVIIAGIKAASEIVIILLLSIFIASILSAFLKILEDKKVPKFIAYVILLFVLTIITFLLSYMVNSSLASFSANLPTYETKIKSSIIKIISYIENYGFAIDKEQILKTLNFSYFFNFTTGLLGNISAVFSKALLVFIGIAFILSESKLLEKKLKVIFKSDHNRLSNFKLFSQNLQKYFIVKTFTSFLTGLFIFIALIFFNIEYPILWAIIGFLFNFIPVIGSIVAAIPAILLSFITGNFEITIWLIIVYMVINITISNVLEPKFMGKELGLSPMVIFFSLIFWGWILGIVGMFLAVPITMTLKIAFESTNNTKWIGVLLSDLNTKRKRH
ncbi:AI-2E family transporter [Malaciobacter molluscorum LMG 25693]|uniref:AI-2E family transporter n=1 Tax=Malaciobacter molluscorum LMG 25693 TaxID=870501 RepID=A0A2G1DG94_9BACT|nr:AI-2E family transporter [Malaciobacter molluscorum]AXX93481.1 putative autoinducer 2 (AI-2E family) transporter [Malaciobacter molluscorum LMG 25693]PHO17505.1 AI-2E family transporter [Malaciobacter molluscorum LMG 25693]RXJ93321.1 AI-2E family transporter [Malaciobacter molluscorum]